MSGKFDDNLGLFPNKNRTSDNHPHYRGKLVISTDTLKTLVEMARAGKEPALSCAAWVNDYEGGKRINVKVQPWVEREQQQRPAPAAVDPFGGKVAEPMNDDLPW